MVVGFAGIGHAAVVMPTADITSVQIEVFVTITTRHDADFQIRITLDDTMFAA